MSSIWDTTFPESDYRESVEGEEEFSETVERLLAELAVPIEEISQGDPSCC